MVETTQESWDVHGSVHGWWCMGAWVVYDGDVLVVVWGYNDLKVF